MYNSNYNCCGKCKNCKDKPRFGGPGIRKKSCSNKKIIGSLYALQILSTISGFILEVDNQINHKIKPEIAIYEINI